MLALDARQEPRTDIGKIETVGVYKNGLGLTYDQMFDKIEDPKSPYSLFNVVALLRDVSQNGFGIVFEGQQVLAGILLRPGHSYILKLTLIMPPVTQRIAPFFKLSENYHYLMVMAVCRWHQQESGRSRAGFELLDSNPPEILQFLCDYFNLQEACRPDPLR
ncbi:MAG: hypothetical protein JW797_09850 [Bradymonadales bacterium]|nr:hypothetical protein [Bradymonadales bacterium]